MGYRPIKAQIFNKTILKIKNKIIIVIPARGGSKGIKLKNLKKIHKRSLLEIVINFSKSLKLTKYIVVSSDHSKILNLAKKNGVIPIKRPKKLSGDFISDYQVIYHSVRVIEKSEKKKFDYIFYLQPTSPFRKKKDILSAFKQVIKEKYDCSFSVSNVDIKYHPKKIFILKGKFINLFSNLGKKILARQQLNKIFIRNGVFYIFNRNKLFFKKSIYLKKNYPFIIRHKLKNIDTYSDLRESRRLAKKLNKF